MPGISESFRKNIRPGVKVTYAFMVPSIPDRRMPGGKRPAR
jgi:hypothetical protein